MFLKALPESFQKNSEKTLKSRSCFNFFVMNLDGRITQYKYYCLLSHTNVIIDAEFRGIFTTQSNI